MRVPDSPDNYSAIDFQLESTESQTIVTLTHSNLIHEAQYEHSNFYWSVALQQIKRVTKNPGSPISS